MLWVSRLNNFARVAILLRAFIAMYARLRVGCPHENDLKAQTEAAAALAIQAWARRCAARTLSFAEGATLIQALTRGFIVRADLARKAEEKATALTQGVARGRWRRLLMKFIFFGVVVVVVGLLVSRVPG